MKIGSVEMYMGPSLLGAPDDLEKTIVEFIDGAEKKLDIAVQELDSWEIGKAIIRARRRKIPGRTARVRVNLVLEADYLTEHRTVHFDLDCESARLKRAGEHKDNRAIHDAILRSAIYVRSDFNPSIFHQKFIVRDGTSVLTGSTNFTNTGTHNNLNHVIIVHDKKVAKIYSKEFKEIRQGHFGKLNEGHDPAPPDVVVSDIPIRILFAPDHNPEMEIMKQMIKAKRRVDFAIFTFAQSSGIDDVMIKLASTKMLIRGALDGMMANQKWAASRTVHNAGAKLFKVSSQTVVGPNGKKHKLGKLHHKLMILDQQVIIAGSFNYTGPATRLNDENIIILGDLESTDKASIKAQKALAKFALAELNRIIEDHGKRLK